MSLDGYMTKIDPLPRALCSEAAGGHRSSPAASAWLDRLLDIAGKPVAALPAAVRQIVPAHRLSFSCETAG